MQNDETFIHTVQKNEQSWNGLRGSGGSPFVKVRTPALVQHAVVQSKCSAQSEGTRLGVQRERALPSRAWR